MLDTTMYVPPKDTKKMSPAEIAAHAAHWAKNVAGELLCIAGQMIPHNYVQIRREPATGDEWLHYGTSWLNAEITDTKVKLAPRAERLEREREDLADAQKQMREAVLLYRDQLKRVKDLEQLDQQNGYRC